MHNTISAIKVFGLLNDHSWLSESELARLRLVTRQLAYEDTSAVNRKLPLTLSVINRAIEYLNVIDGGEDLLIAVTMLLAHNGLLRANEYLRGIQVKDITWQSNSLTLSMPRTKTCRDGPGEVVVITDYPGNSAFKFMRRWFRTQNLWGKNEAFVIPFVLQQANHQFDQHRPASVRWWDRALSRVLQRTGLNPSLYSGHSFRAGGATDLFLQGVPYASVKRYGRWKSDTALIYLRDEIGVSNTVANAFANATGMSQNF